MPRPIWKGHISFGLVNIPVALYPAEQPDEMHFNLIDSRDHARVRYERVNEATGAEVPWNKVVKGYEYSDGNYVLLSDADFKKAAVEATQTIEIEDFVDAEKIDWIFIDKPYFLEPGKKGEKGFVLLRETLKRAKKVAIAKVVIRAREHLAAVLPHGAGLVVMLLRFYQELRDYDDYNLPTGSLKDYKITDKELKMAQALVESMYTEWKPERYEDEYRRKLMAWIEKKAAARGTEPLATGNEEEAEPAASVVNIMDLLEESVRSRQRKKAPPRKTKARRKHA